MHISVRLLDAAKALPCSAANLLSDASVLRNKLRLYEDDSGGLARVVAAVNTLPAGDPAAAAWSQALAPSLPAAQRTAALAELFGLPADGACACVAGASYPWPVPGAWPAAAQAHLPPGPAVRPAVGWCAHVAGRMWPGVCDQTDGALMLVACISITLLVCSNHLHCNAVLARGWVFVTLFIADGAGL